MRFYLMSSLIVFSLESFARSNNYSTCPNLTGKYRCTTINDEKSFELKISQRVEATHTIYEFLTSEQDSASSALEKTTFIVDQEPYVISHTDSVSLARASTCMQHSLVSETQMIANEGEDASLLQRYVTSCKKTTAKTMECSYHVEELSVLGNVIPSDLKQTCSLIN